MIWLVLAAAAADPEPLAAGDVVWVKRPTGEQLGALYPERALRLDLDGRAVVTVTLDDQGVPKACAVKEDEELGAAFGAATCAATEFYRAGPLTRSGVPVAGRRVDIAVNWRLPPPPDGSPRRPPLVTGPIHAEIPNERHLDKFYPRAAWRAGRGGVGEIVLEFEESGGRPIGCEVLAEGPSGDGFGAATCAVFTAGFRARPRAAGTGRFRYVARLVWSPSTD